MVPISKTQMEDGKISPTDLLDIQHMIRSEGNQRDHYDVVMIGMTPDPEDLSNISEYSEVGATWWIEASAPWSRTLDEMKEQIRRGPPRP